MNGIVNLAIATGAFVGSHLLLSHPLRAPIVARLGERGFMGAYSLAALTTFGWLIWARLGVESLPTLWVAGRGVWDLATLVMLFASILLAGSFIGNPAAPDPNVPTGPIPPARGVFAITRHPMMWSFVIWAIVHIALWGSPANLIISGGILALAFFGMIGQDSKKLALQGERWRDWMDRTAFFPFAGQIGGRIPWTFARLGWGVVFGGLVIFLGATWMHGWLGAPAAGIWRWIG